MAIKILPQFLIDNVVIAVTQQLLMNHHCLVTSDAQYTGIDTGPKNQLFTTKSCHVHPLVNIAPLMTSPPLVCYNTPPKYC